MHVTAQRLRLIKILLLASLKRLLMFFHCLLFCSTLLMHWVWVTGRGAAASGTHSMSLFPTMPFMPLISSQLQIKYSLDLNHLLPNVALAATFGIVFEVRVDLRPLHPLMEPRVSSLDSIDRTTVSVSRLQLPLALRKSHSRAVTENQSRWSVSCRAIRLSVSRILIAGF